MNNGLYTEEHQIFRDMFKKFVSKEITPNVEQWEADRAVPRELWLKMGEQGFLCPWLPEEFGGLGLPLEDHTWLNKDNWGYRTFANADTLFRTYSGYLDQIERFIIRGLSAAIYTQTTDVEIETNGLMTYDRKVVKVPETRLSQASRKLYEAAAKIPFR